MLSDEIWEQRMPWLHKRFHEKNLNKLECKWQTKKHIIQMHKHNEIIISILLPYKCYVMLPDISEITGLEAGCYNKKISTFK